MKLPKPIKPVKHEFSKYEIERFKEKYEDYLFQLDAYKELDKLNKDLKKTKKNISMEQGE